MAAVRRKTRAVRGRISISLKIRARRSSRTARGGTDQERKSRSHAATLQRWKSESQRRSAAASFLRGPPETGFARTTTQRLGSPGDSTVSRRWRRGYRPPGLSQAVRAWRTASAGPRPRSAGRQRSQPAREAAPGSAPPMRHSNELKPRSWPAATHLRRGVSGGAKRASTMNMNARTVRGRRV